MEGEKPDDLTNPAGDDADTNGGTPDAGAGNAETDANREKLLQTLQEKAARVNAAEAKAQELQARMDAIERAQSPAARGGDPRAERLATVRRFADGSIGEGPDPVAAEVLALREDLASALNEVSNLRELDQVSDTAKRQKIAKHFNENRHRLGDVRAARAEIEREELSEQLTKEREQTEKLKRALEASAKRSGPDVVKTHALEVTATEHQAREMTRAEFQSRQKQLMDAGNAGDREAHKQRMREQRLLREGKIVYKE